MDPGVIVARRKWFLSAACGSRKELVTRRRIVVNRNELRGMWRKSAGKKSLALMLAVMPAALWSSAAVGANLTWDSSGSHPAAPVDGSGNWNTLTADWSNGTVPDVVWDNVSTAVFGSGGTAGIVTINDASGTV